MTSGTLPEPAWELAGADHFRQWSGELEVFRVDLDRLDVEGLAGSALATSEERTRAGRFQRSDDRRRYL
ncbi:MAG: hypothetical protein ABEL76_09720, partial [Bradymonadaceae bacterium]